MIPQWLHLWLTRNRFNAARDRRQAAVRMDRELDQRLALRKAARLEPDPWKRGHITRRLNAGAV